MVGPSLRRVTFPHVPSGIFALDKGVFRGGEPRVEVGAADAKVAPDSVSPRACVLDAPLLEGFLGNLQFMADLLGRHPLVDETGIVVSWLVIGVLATNLVPFQTLFGGVDYGGLVAVVQASSLSFKDILPREYGDRRANT